MIIKAWIAKYALTKGIVEVEAEWYETSPSQITYGDAKCRDYAWHEGRDWFRTRESAVRRANQMRAAKIASLHKQIVKLWEVKFE